jgi:O-antigen/teichoic acid export membrane protein
VSNQLVNNISNWTLPDLIDLPAKAIVYFLLVNLLDKEIFGMLNLAMMIFSYHALAQVGVVNWLMYELPKKYTLKQNMKNTLTDSYHFTLINQLILSVLICLIIVVFNDIFFISLALLVYLLHTIFYNSYLHKTLFLRYQYKFKKLLKLRVFFTLTRFFLEVIAIIYFGVYGYLAVQAFIFIIPIALLKSDINFDLKLTMTLDKYKSLALNGAPFFVVTLLSIILGNLDRWFIVSVYGLEWFATYSVGIFIVTAILIIPGKVLSIFTQYLKEMFISVQDINLNVERSFSINNLLVFMLLATLMVGNAFEYLVLHYLPKYSDIVPFINAFMLLIVLKFSVSLVSNMLYLLNKRGSVSRIQIFVTVLYVPLLAVVYYLDMDILFAIWSMNLIFMIQIFATIFLIFSTKGVRTNVEVFKFSMLVLIGIIFYFSNDFTSMKVLLSHYIVAISLVFVYKINITRRNISYVSTRSFEKG